MSASQRDPEQAGRDARLADISVGLARPGTIDADAQELTNPEWVELLMFANGQDLPIRASLASTFPNKQTAVGGVVLTGNASLDTQSAGTESVVELVDAMNLDGFDVTATGSLVYLKEIND